MAETVGFEPTTLRGHHDFEFYRRLLDTWFLLSVSVSLVRLQTHMKSGLFEKTPENTEKSHIGSNQRFFRFWKELRKERKEQKSIGNTRTVRMPAKITKILRCIVMKENAINWDDVPDVITKDQLYRICHISKSTALYLLQSGKIPCEYTGRKTRCYKIKKEDVIAYLENRKAFPESYSAPAGWYKGDYTVQMEEQVPQIVLEHLQLYYTELLSGYPDVLTTQTVSKITGYGKTSINNWCNQGHIKSFRKNNVNHIPKVYLVEFFCSTYFRTITRKSPWHIRTLQGFSSWRKIRDLHTADSEGGAE